VLPGRGFTPTFDPSRLETEQVEDTAQGLIDDLGERLRLGIKAGTGGAITAPISDSAVMVRR